MFDWSEYLRFAEWLLDQSKSSPTLEATQRAAVSRAYYAAHVPARRLADKRGIVLDPNYSVHVGLIRALKGHKNANFKRVGLWLDRMHKYRIEADYEDEVRDLPVKVNDTIASSKQVLNYLNAL